MSDFKSGDKVKIASCADRCWWYSDLVGKIYTLRSKSSYGWSLEEVSCADEDYYIFSENDLELVKEKPLVLEEHPLESYPNKTNSSEERQLVGKKFQVHGCGDVYKIIDLAGNKYSVVNDSTPADTECGKHTKEAVYRYFDEGTWVFLDKNQVEDVKPIKSDGYAVDHYSTFYKLTDKDIEAGEIKVDAYWVAKQWKTGSRDDSGALWHSLKTIARFGDKNCKAREIKALYNQAIALARIYEVDLSE